MPSLSFASCVGPLTIHEQCGAITGLCWGRRENREVSSLLVEARSQVQEYLKGARSRFELPKNPIGTRYQVSVWKEIDQIAYGQTASYGDLAQKLSSYPRPIGSACGKNPIPIIIPCHRVITKAGKSGGYSGGKGLKTKTLLLSMEAAASRA